MNFIIFHSEKNFIISGVCLVRSLSFRSLSFRSLSWHPFTGKPVIRALQSLCGDWRITSNSIQLLFKSKLLIIIIIWISGSRIDLHPWRPKDYLISLWYHLVVKPCMDNYDLWFNCTYSQIFSDPLEKYGNARFTTVPLKPLSGQYCERYLIHVLESDLAFTGKSVGIAPMKDQLKLRSPQSL